MRRSGSFQPNTEDPEFYLTAAAMRYNHFLLLAPEVVERRDCARTHCSAGTVLLTLDR
jgi:hypothetical protein